MRTGRIVCGLVCLFLSFAFGSLPAVADDGYLDEASQGLQISKVYASVSVRSIKAADVQSLVAQIGDKQIGVVVLPDAARADVGDGSDFLPRLMDRSGYPTLLVTVGATFLARSTVLTSEQLAPIVSKAQTGGIPAGLVSFVQEVKPLLVAPAPQQPTPQPDSGWPLWVWLLGGAVILAIALVAFIRFGPFRAARTQQYSTPTPSAPPASTPGGFQHPGNWSNDYPGRPSTGP